MFPKIRFWQDPVIIIATLGGGDVTKKARKLDSARSSRDQKGLAADFNMSVLLDRSLR